MRKRAGFGQTLLFRLPYPLFDFPRVFASIIQENVLCTWLVKVDLGAWSLNGTNFQYSRSISQT